MAAKLTSVMKNHDESVTAKQNIALTSFMVLEFKWRDKVVPSARSTSKSDKTTSATNSLRENLS